MLMIVLDITVVNVALPSIRRDLGFSEAGRAWVVNAYPIGPASPSAEPVSAADSDSPDGEGGWTGTLEGCDAYSLPLRS
jgi:MFS family permease